MLKVHQNCIISNLAILVDETDLSKLVPELINRNVFNDRMICRILNPSHNSKRQKTDLYTEILKRGPQAFAKLQDALIATDHSNLAEILNPMDPQPSSLQLYRSSSLNSVESNRSQDSSDNENLADGPTHSSVIRKPHSQIDVAKRANGSSSTDLCDTGSVTGSVARSEKPELKMSSTSNFVRPNILGPESKVSTLPAYERELIEEDLRSHELIHINDIVNYVIERNRPVQVRHAEQWQSTTMGKPQMYKMDSNPRGYALLINNKEFYDKEEFPDRLGSENDEIRMKELLKQLHYEVEFHDNKTKTQMEEIVENFSQKPELNDVDSVILVFMSHGEEGASEEDSEIMGVDGIGYKTEKIISQFYNDSCRALIHKPKIFFFQACRGNLTDPGVTVGHLTLNHRTVTDGRDRRNGRGETRSVIIRTFSDVFVAFPTAPGRKANRDFITGAWFIQTIVDVFSEFACSNHLEDLMKMVDDRIKQMNNLHRSNFQTVTIKTIGWNKNLFFNPGLSRDKVSKETIRIGYQRNRPAPDEGMDVVDTIGPNSGNTYSRLKDDKTEDQDENSGCFNFSCRPS